jgi:hypothetical protein
VFPADIIDGNDPISEKKLPIGEGQYALFKTLLGFDFDGQQKTVWLEEQKRAKLLPTLRSWVQAGDRKRGVPFKEFESVVAKLRHAFTALPGGQGLLSPCNRLLKKRPWIVYFHRNKPLLSAISNCQTILRESTKQPTHCRELVAGWPNFVGVVDESSHVVGGVIIGGLSECSLTVFCLKWPPDISEDVISKSNPTGKITNSDLELAGLTILWLVMEHVCGPLTKKRVAIFSNNSPTVSWVHCMASCSSLVAKQLIRVLALQFNLQKICPITTLHIVGNQNQMTDIPSCSFGSKSKWHFKTDEGLLTFFQLALSSANTELLVGLPTHLRNSYACDFRLAYEAFHTGRLEVTSRGRKKYWDHWQAYTAPMGVDPYLQDTQFSKQIRLLSGFAARVRTGFYGQQ